MDKGLADLEKLSEYNLWSLGGKSANYSFTIHCELYSIHSHRCGSCCVQEWFCNEIQQLPMVDDHGFAIRHFVVV